MPVGGDNINCECPDFCYHSDDAYLSDCVELKKRKLQAIVFYISAFATDGITDVIHEFMFNSIVKSSISIIRKSQLKLFLRISALHSSDVPSNFVRGGFNKFS
jgi:hypothetical protein